MESTLKIRCSVELRHSLEQEAALAGLTLSALIRRRLGAEEESTLPWRAQVDRELSARADEYTELDRRLGALEEMASTQLG